MKPDEINRLWQLSMNDSEGMRLGFKTQQHYFAALVAAAERERCAQICDSVAANAVLGTANECARAIRGQ